MLFNVDDKRLVVTVSDGEGSGSVAVRIWMPREQFQPRICRIDVPAAWLEEWSDRNSRKNLIMEIEGVGPIIALTTWPDLLRDVLWIHFVDNESSKFALIKGNSKANSLNKIVHATWTECWKRRIFPWWERVATKDNPVDKASRGDLSDYYNEGWQIVPAQLPAFGSNALWQGE